MMGDCLATAGDDRAAASHYRAAINAAPPPNQLPAELREEISRAESMCERYAAQFETFLRERLAARGFVEGRSSARFSDSLDIQTGRKRIYFQEPRQYFFPSFHRSSFTPGPISRGWTSSKRRPTTFAPSCGKYSRKNRPSNPTSSQLRAGPRPITWVC